MINYNSLYLSTDQPTTCPLCGARTEFFVDLSHTKDKIQIHQCLAENCKYEFLVQGDEEYF